MARYRHIIWDWNGTLMDDAWLAVEALNLVMRHHGKPLVTLESYQAEFGWPVEDFYRRLGFSLDRKAFEGISHIFMGEYERRKFECALHAGAKDTVERLHASGIRQDVLSAYHQAKLGNVIAHYGIAACFEALIGNPDIFAGSKLDNARAHLKTLPHGPSEILLVGDTLHDLEVAEALGADCVLLAGGHVSRSRLASTGRPVLDGPGEVLAFVLGAGC